MSDVKISFIPKGGVKRNSFTAQMGLAIRQLTESCIGKNLIYLYDGGELDNELLVKCNLIISQIEVSLAKETIVVKDIDFINDGSIINISEAGKLRVLFNPKSNNNALFVTDACNNYCVMCPQPPKPVISPNTKEYLMNIIDLIRDEDRPNTIGITGGEPTIIGRDLIDVMLSIKNKFPDTVIQLLSNGRLFSYPDYAQEMAEISSNMFIGIPLFGATPERHDFIVQNKGAFEQAIAGMYECRRNKISIELRIVLHKYTIEDLNNIVHLIKRTLPFVNHIALMGMENMGFAKMNYSDLWIDPIEYKNLLKDTVLELSRFGLSVSVFNLPFCVLSPEIWQFSKQSISDYKTAYLNQCDDCVKKSECAGLFSSTNDKFKLTELNNISPIKE